MAQNDETVYYDADVAFATRKCPVLTKIPVQCRRMKFVISLIALLLLACSAPFEPANCPTENLDKLQQVTDFTAPAIITGERDGECFFVFGEVLQVVDGGYRVQARLAGLFLGVSPSDLFLRWEGEPALAEADLIKATGVADGALTYETMLGTERIIPALHGAAVEILTVKSSLDVSPLVSLAHPLGAEASIPERWRIQEDTGKCKRYISRNRTVTGSLCAEHLDERLAESDDPLGGYARRHLGVIDEYFRQTDGFESELGNLVYSDEYTSPVYVIDYLVHSDFGHCVEDRIALVGLGRDSEGKLYGATWRVGLCQDLLEQDQDLRSALLQSFKP